MGIFITKDIAYWTESVACFDPEKVLEKLLEAFPEAEIDPVDHAEEQLNRMRSFASEQIESEERRRKLIAQATANARRNGPGYHFQLRGEDGAIIQGFVARYCVGFKSDKGIDANTQQRMIDFLNSLDLGTIHHRPYS